MKRNLVATVMICTAFILLLKLLLQASYTNNFSRVVRGHSAEQRLRRLQESTLTNTNSKPESDIPGTVKHRTSLYLYLNTSTPKYDMLPSVRMCTMPERRQHLKNICKKYRKYLDSPMKRKNLLVSDALSLAVCLTPKCASTTLLALVGKSVSGGRDLEVLRWEHASQIPYGMSRWNLRMDKFQNTPSWKAQGYTKIFALRHPFERLISAYRNKVVKSPKAYEWTKKSLRKIYHLNQTSIPTFEMFVDAIMNHNWQRNEVHWCKVGDYCKFCEMEYDYILRAETLQEDIRDVLKLLNKTQDDLDNLTSNVSRGNSNGTVKTTQNEVSAWVIEEFKNMPSKLTNQLYEHFKYDFLIGGYSFDLGSSTGRCSIETADGGICC